MGQNDPPREQDPYVNGPGGCTQIIAIPVLLFLAVLAFLLAG